MTYNVPKSFYEGVIYITAEKIREKDWKHEIPSDCDNRLVQAEIYFGATKRVLALLKEDLDCYWELGSIQRRLGFKPNDPYSLDDSEIQLVLDTLVSYGYIKLTEQKNTFGSNRSFYYKLPYKRKSWTETTIEIIMCAVVAYFAYKYFPFKQRYLYNHDITGVTGIN